MVEYYAYLFLGEDEATKKNKIDSIKTSYLDKSLKDIDFEVVYSDDKELNPPKFNEILSYLPANPSKKRIVFVKNIESLTNDNREVLLRYLKNPLKSILLLLDSNKLNPDDLFIRELNPFVKKFNFKREIRLDTFNLTQAIIERKTTDALKILNTLLHNKEKPHSILGGLFWQWDNMKDRLNLEKFRQGLKLLLDTDIRIKTEKLQEEIALELLIVRLSYLI